jgi:phosphatidylglycerophosphate synthase
MTNLTLYAIKPRFVKALDGVTNGLAAAGVSPDAVTLFALPVAFLIAAALLVGTVWPALWLFVPVGSVALMATNAIDGSLARRTTATKRGAVLNEFVDRTGDVLILGSLCFIVGVSWGGAALVSVLLAEMVALIAWGALGTRALVGIMGKPDRALIVSCAAVFGFFFGLRAFTPAAVVIAVGGLVTTAQRVIWAVRHAG